MYLYYNKKKIFLMIFFKLPKFTLNHTRQVSHAMFFLTENVKNKYLKPNFLQRYKDLVKTKTGVEKLKLECF